MVACGVLRCVADLGLMIVDELCCADDYFALGDGIRRALCFLKETDLDGLATGRHEIDGDRVFAGVDMYETKPMEIGFWEAHKKYLDVQCVIAGEERLGYAPVSGMSAGPYDEDRDFYKLEGDGDFITLRPGMFAILKPQDAHMPGMANGEPKAVKKIVVKVLV